MVARLIGFYLLALGSSGVLACEWSGSQRLNLAERFALHYRFEPTPPPVAEFISVDLRVCRNDEFRPFDTVRLVAVMPAHGHGMNYRPGVVVTSRIERRVDGLLLHMRGLWRFTVTFTEATKTHVASFDLTVE